MVSAQQNLASRVYRTGIHTMLHGSLAPICPLCSANEANKKSEVLFSEIWNRLRSDWGASFTKQTVDKLTPAAQTNLLECSDCHLQYFHPAAPGSDDFYSQLTQTSPNYYCTEKWDFQFAKRYAAGANSLLDVACGSGHFLETLRGITQRRVGVDTNPHAVRTATANSLEVHLATLEDFALTHHNIFDVVTAFQVLEYLGSIADFARAAYDCVKPGGLLIVTVPNRDRRNREDFEPLDHPPHHISRWSEQQFERVAKMLGASLVHIEREPMSSAQMVVALRNREMMRIPKSIPGRNYIIKAISRAILAFPISHVFYAIDMPRKLELYGMSMAAVLKKPETS